MEPSTSSPSLPVPAPVAAPATSGRARALAIGLFVAAAAVLVGVFTKHWIVPERGSGGAGPTGLEVCYEGRCESASWSRLEALPGDIELFALLSIIGGLASAAVAAIGGGMALAGHARKIPVKPFSVVLGLTAFATTMFAMRVLTEMKQISISWSGFVAVGALLAIGALLKAAAAPARVTSPS